MQCYTLGFELINLDRDHKYAGQNRICYDCWKIASVPCATSHPSFATPLGFCPLLLAPNPIHATSYAKHSLHLIAVAKLADLVVGVLLAIDSRPGRVGVRRRHGRKPWGRDGDGREEDDGDPDLGAEGGDGLGGYG